MTDYYSWKILLNTFSHNSLQTWLYPVRCENDFPALMSCPFVSHRVVCACFISPYCCPAYRWFTKWQKLIDKQLQHLVLEKAPASLTNFLGVIDNFHELENSNKNVIFECVCPWMDSFLSPVRLGACLFNGLPVGSSECTTLSAVTYR